MVKRSLNTATVLLQPKAGRKASTGILVAIVVACILGLVAGAIFFARNQPTGSPGKVEHGIDLNEVKAKADNGDAAAQNTMGEMCIKGQAAPLNYAEAVKWFRKAAEQGNPAAQSNLGMMYEAGQGVPVGYAEAANWYRRAAEQGHPDGQYNLAVMYTFGRGVAPDMAEAVKWFRLAAEQGDGLAQYNLGQRYRIAKGVPQDLVEAYKWLALAAAQRVPDAAKDRDAMKSSMTREQISEARRRVSAFVPKKSMPVPAAAK
jgi:uncharacterized protein